MLPRSRGRHHIEPLRESDKVFLATELINIYEKPRMFVVWELF